MMPTRDNGTLVGHRLDPAGAAVQALGVAFALLRRKEGHWTT